jgi:hypothetical protein
MRVGIVFKWVKIRVSKHYTKTTLFRHYSLFDETTISTKQASHRTMATPSEAQATTNADTATNSFHVGQLVNVAPRTWPGINQPGGIGRITGLARDRVSVRYVLDGRHEKEIDIKYVGIHQQGPIRRLRNRSMLLGRCNVCGSLRTDCGSCDLWIEEEQVRASRTLARATEDSLLLATHNEDDDDEGNNNDDKSSSSDNEEFEKIQKQNQRRYRKYLRMKARAQPYFDDSSSDGSSEKDVEPKAGDRKGPKKEKIMQPTIAAIVKTIFLCINWHCRRLRWNHRFLPGGDSSLVP